MGTPFDFTGRLAAWTQAALSSPASSGGRFRSGNSTVVRSYRGLVLVGNLSDGIFQPTDRVLEFTFGLFGHSLRFELLIANHLAG